MPLRRIMVLGAAVLLALWSTAQLYQSPDGNVGIGTTSPQAKLHVAGGDVFLERGSFIGAYLASHQDVGTKETRFGSYINGGFSGMKLITSWNASGYNNDQLAFWTHEGGSSLGEQMRIAANGNVGIGTTDPAYLLDVKGQAQVSDGIKYGGNDWVGPANIVAGYNTSYDNSLALRADNSIIFARAAGLETMRIDANGYVGIGTTSPENRLHIQNGSIVVKNVRWAANSEFPLVYGTQHVNGLVGYAGLYLYEDGSGGFGQASGLSFKVSTNDVEPATAMVIRGNGSISIGTTDTKGYKLAVAGDAVVQKLVVKQQQNWPEYVFHSIAYLLPPAVERGRLCEAEPASSRHPLGKRGAEGRHRRGGARPGCCRRSRSSRSTRLG